MAAPGAPTTPTRPFMRPLPPPLPPGVPRDPARGSAPLPAAPANTARIQGVPLEKGKKKLKVSNTPYLTKALALRDTHNTVWAPRRLLKRPHPLFKGTIARSVRSHGPAMQAWYRALRDYGVCKWTSIQPLNQSGPLVGKVATSHLPSRGSPPLQSGRENQKWPTCGQGGYVTPAVSGIPTTSERGANMKTQKTPKKRRQKYCRQLGLNPGPLKLAPSATTN